MLVRFCFLEKLLVVNEEEGLLSVSGTGFVLKAGAACCLLRKGGKAWVLVYSSSWKYALGLGIWDEMKVRKIF